MNQISIQRPSEKSAVSAALRDIVVYVDDSEASPARLTFAARLARAQGAHLTAVAALHLPALPGRARVETGALFIEALQANLAAKAKKLAAEVAAVSAAEGVGIEWRQLDGQADRAVVAHARHADLTIVGQRSDDASEDSNRLLEALIMEAGRPVLAVPAYGKVERFGHHVLCAWNGTREAARAVADALPLLCQAEKVTILSIDPDQAATRLPGADIALHLARHGVKAEASTTFSGGLSVGDALLARASDLGADLIVMGAYGHSRAREAVFGGATRSLLDTMTLPVLMSH